MLLTHSGLLDDTEQATVHKKRMGNQPKHGHPNPLSTAVRT